MIKEDIHRVVGLKRRRKVYSLTPKGLERAREIRKQLENEKVILKKDSSEHEVELGKIDSYIDSQNPLLLALNNINDERVINLTQKEIQKKEDVFVGRKDEIEFLLKKLNHLKNNNSLAILIKGKAGIGKTRLVNEFKHKAIPAGFEFLMGKGHYDSSEPYLPFKEA
ncbi:MAG: AAA family ATPase, partial [Candidatus Saliniplasma sp.]